MGINWNKIKIFFAGLLIFLGLVQVYNSSIAQVEEEQVTGKATLADQAVARELFEKAKDYPESQSYGQLRAPFVQGKVLDLAGLARHEQIINLAL